MATGIDYMNTKRPQTYVYTFGYLSQFNWEKTCEVLGLSEWILNEGQADPEDEIELTEQQAKDIGLID